MTATYPERVPPTGWYLEAVHDSGAVRTPTILEGAQFVPSLNGRPSASIPVPRDEGWRDGGWERATVRVWRDGERLPLEELVDVTLQADRTVLELTGGVELADRMETAIDQQAAHLAAEDIIQAETGYVANVDAPDTETITGQQLLSASTQSDLEDVLGPIPEDEPFELANGTLSLYQTCWTQEGENYDDVPTGRGAPSDFFGPAFSGAGVEDGDGVTALFDSSGDGATYQFTSAYRIPDPHLDIAFRLGIPAGTSDPNSIRVLLDGDVLGTFRTGTGGVDWLNLSDIVAGFSGTSLEPGTHTLSLKTETVNSDDQYVDLVAPFDDRFSYLFDDSVTTQSDGDNTLDGPALYPDGTSIQTTDGATPYVVREATFSVSGAAESVAVSNDFGVSFQSDAGTDVTASFAEPGGAARGRITLGATGTRTTATPATGFESQSVDSLELTATVDDTPILVGEPYSGAVENVLNEIADYSDQVWALEYDPSADTLSVEWTEAGVRTGTVPADAVSYSATKTTEPYGRVVVEGGAQAVRDEALTAAHGTAVALEEDSVILGSETVVSADTGESYQRQTDYQLDAQAGTVTALASGDISDGESLTVSYRYRPTGAAPPDADASATTLSAEIPAVATQRGAEQAALVIYQAIDEPFWQAEATIDPAAAGVSLVEALSVEALPDAVPPLEVWEVETGPEEIRLQLGSRDSVEQVISRLQSQLRAASKRV